MIDNIRFNFLFQPDENWFSNLKKYIDINEKYSTQKGKALSGKLFLDYDNKKSSNGKSLPYLLIEIKVIYNEGVRVIVKNSLRKWFFGSQVAGEFNKEQFKECLIALAGKLCVPVKILFESKVTQIEYGSNISLEPKYSYFYACIYEHLDLKHKCTYGNETVEFRGENRSVIFYDKVAELTGKFFKTKNKNKLDEKIFVLRYEIKVKKLSGAPENPLMNHLELIIKNWDKIADLWYDELNKISFVNNMNAKTYDYLKNARIKPIKDYLIYVGIKNIGIETWRLIFNDRIYAKIRKTAMDAQMKAYEEFNVMMQEENFEKTFRKKVREKVIKLKA